jgi:hypothetical protein
MSISFTRQLRVPSAVLLQELAGETVLLNLNNERYFGLDDVGTCMWKKLTTSPTIEAAHESLLSDFAVEPEQLRRDLERLIDQLVEHELVEVCPG